ncbi:hypothetical protein PF467_004081 [Salmonella enterica]|nr:hypothetical protein [Salmonella enterica]EKI6583800.1 hypothetical protein [Salmonella enterica]
MLDNRTASAIDLALQKHHTPVGDLYAAIRHGRMKRCFSRDTAICWLAHFLTSHSFTRSGFKQRYPDFLVVQDHGEQVWRRGETTDAYHRAHQRTIRSLRLILARKREIQKWNEKYDEWAVRWDELMKQKPY